MPFKSEKQRRYMHANEPNMAKKSEGYADGGMIKKLAKSVRFRDLPGLRSGGVISTGSTTPSGVVNANKAACKKFMDN